MRGIFAGVVFTIKSNDMSIQRINLRMKIYCTEFQKKGEKCIDKTGG